MPPNSLVNPTGARCSKLCICLFSSSTRQPRAQPVVVGQETYQLSQLQLRAFTTRHAASLPHCQTLPQPVSPGLVNNKTRWAYTYGCRSLQSSEQPTALPINKLHGGTVMTDQLYRYLLAHTQEHEVLKWLRKETAIQFPVGARMQVSPEQAQFMAWLVQLTGVTKAMELGIFTGYSALAVALALPEHGKLVACDRDNRPLQLAQAAFAKAMVSHKVDVRQGLAMDTLHSVLEQPEEAASFDFIFIDADKRAYADYFELCLKLLRPGGILALDNVLWYGKVADPGVQDKKTSALRELNASLVQDERIRLSIVPVGDGMALCTKR